MDPIVLFLKDDILPDEKKLLGFGYPKIKSSTSAIFLDCIYYAFILKQQKHSWKSYMKGFVEVIQEEDLYLIEPLLKTISGQICKKKRKNM